MNYIVVDFEWNQAGYGGGKAHKKMPFEIIEIGAVKLDDDLNEIDRFSQTIRPRVYKKLHRVTHKLTGITQEELDASDPFPYAAVDFMLWCGDDYTFCTWGNTDLTELQRNMRYYHLDDLLAGPIRYYNVQKFYRLLYTHEDNGVSLEQAMDYFHLEKPQRFHRAMVDALCTADILRQMDLKTVDDLFTIDYYRNPQTKKDEIHLTYDTYYKYISREFATKDEALSDREVRSTCCYKCGRPARKKIRWFASRTKAFYCLAWCPEHGYIRGKLRIRKDDDGDIFVVKTLRLTDEEGAQKIRQMKEDVIKKRREKRHRESRDAQIEGDTADAGNYAGESAAQVTDYGPDISDVLTEVEEDES